MAHVVKSEDSVLRKQETSTEVWDNAVAEFQSDVEFDTDSAEVPEETQSDEVAPEEETEELELSEEPTGQALRIQDSGHFSAFHRVDQDAKVKRPIPLIPGFS